MAIRLFIAWILAMAALPASAAEVDGFRVWTDPDKTRAVLDLDARTEYHLFTLENPPRVVIDLQQSALDDPLKLDADHAGIIDSVRHGKPKKGTLRVVLDLEKKSFKMMDGRLQAVFGGISLKYGLQPSMRGINVSKRPQEEMKILQVECAMHEIINMPRFTFHYKIIRRIAHEFHQALGISDNHLAVSPGKGSCEKTGNLDVFFLTVAMGNAYGICFDKLRPVIQISLLIEKIF